MLSLCELKKKKLSLNLCVHYLPINLYIKCEMLLAEEEVAVLLQ